MSAISGDEAVRRSLATKSGASSMHTSHSGQDAIHGPPTRSRSVGPAASGNAGTRPLVAADDTGSAQGDVGLGDHHALILCPRGPDIQLPNEPHHGLLH